MTAPERVTLRSGHGNAGPEVARILGLDVDKVRKTLEVKIPTDSHAVAVVELFLTPDELREITAVILGQRQESNLCRAAKAGYVCTEPRGHDGDHDASGYHQWPNEYDTDCCQAATDDDDGFLCTESPNHDGDHIATGPDGEVYRTWPQDVTRSIIP